MIGPDRIKLANSLWQRSEGGAVKDSTSISGISPPPFVIYFLPGGDICSFVSVTSKLPLSASLKVLLKRPTSSTEEDSQST